MKVVSECITGGKSVIASGIGITCDSESCYDIKLKFTKDFEYTVRFSFIKKQEDEKPSLKLETHMSDKLTELECCNFDDAIGTGTTRPIEILSYVGQPVMVNFWVRTPLEGVNREIRYCFYMSLDTGDTLNDEKA